MTQEFLYVYTCVKINIIVFAYVSGVTLLWLAQNQPISNHTKEHHSAKVKESFKAVPLHLYREPRQLSCTANIVSTWESKYA